MVSLLVKLCPLICFALIVGCGKKVNETTTSSAGFEEPIQELSSDLILQVDETKSDIKLFKLPKNAWFKLPTQLIVKSGNAVGKKIKIYYNFHSLRKYEFYCTYQSKNQDSTLAFENCKSSQGNEMISDANELKAGQFPMDKGSSVKIQLTNPSGTGMKIESTYIVDWK